MVLDIIAFGRTEREPAFVCLRFSSKDPWAFDWLGHFEPLPVALGVPSVGWRKPGWRKPGVNLDGVNLDDLKQLKYWNSNSKVYRIPPISFYQPRAQCVAGAGVGVPPSVPAVTQRGEGQDWCWKDRLIVPRCWCPLTGYLPSSSPCSPPLSSVWHLTHFSHAFRVLDNEFNSCPPPLN